MYGVTPAGVAAGMLEDVAVSLRAAIIKAVRFAGCSGCTVTPTYGLNERNSVRKASRPCSNGTRPHRSHLRTLQAPYTKCESMLLALSRNRFALCCLRTFNGRANPVLSCPTGYAGQVTSRESPRGPMSHLPPILTDSGEILRAVTILSLFFVWSTKFVRGVSVKIAGHGPSK